MELIGDHIGLLHLIVFLFGNGVWSLCFGIEERHKTS